MEYHVYTLFDRRLRLWAAVTTVEYKCDLKERNTVKCRYKEVQFIAMIQFITAMGLLPDT